MIKSMIICTRKILLGSGHDELAHFDELVFKSDKGEIVISLYRAKNGGGVEIRSNTGTLVIHPRTSNMVEVDQVAIGE